MRNSVRVPDLDGAVGRDVPKEGPDHALRLIGSPHEGVTDVKEDDGVDPRGRARL